MRRLDHVNWLGVEPVVNRDFLRDTLGALVTEQIVLDSGEVAGKLAGFDERTIDRLVDGTHRHARRRADEMAAATEQLLELGVPARIAPAARDLLAALRDAGSPH
ncbi:DUF1932 domain-containing protein [Modestobacter sp. I12A-02662]|uniref:DUF1932 domain-containing protein n=1 Tax=Modestobacter sp. I12A-02662 TaxID=1730496 RepID=UPI0034DE152C